MTNTLSSDPAIRAGSATVGNHTVGVESVPRSMRFGQDARLWSATVMVVERYNGQPIAIVTTDTDVFNDRPLDDVAAEYAAGKCAQVVEAQYPACDHCGWPIDICDNPAEHAWMASANESSWR